MRLILVALRSSWLLAYEYNSYEVCVCPFWQAEGLGCKFIETIVSEMAMILIGQDVAAIVVNLALVKMAKTFDRLCLTAS